MANRFPQGVYVEGGVTAEFEEVRRAVKEKFERDPDGAGRWVEEEERVSGLGEQKDAGGVVVKKEEVDGEESGLGDGPVVTTTSAATVGEKKTNSSVTTPFVVPPPVIKIFSFGPRVK